jgi:RND family efflux transporter MFP subunit
MLGLTENNSQKKLLGVDTMLNRISSQKILGISFILISTFLSGCDNQESSLPKKEFIRPAKLHHVTATVAGNMLHFPGKVRPGKEAALAFLVPGRLDQLVVLEGQQVKKGDVIAKLEARDFELVLTEIQATLNELSLALKRKKKLQKKGFVAQAAVDKAQAAYDSAMAAKNSAQRNVGYTTLKAPFSGIISKRFIENHQNIATGTPIVQLQNLQDLEVRIHVPEQVMVTIRKEDVLKSEALFEALPLQRFLVKYKEHVSEADPKTLTYEVTLSLTPIPGFNILPGMTTTVEVNFKNRSEHGEIEIPVDALISDDNGGFFVWVTSTEGGKVEKQAVEVKKLGTKKALLSSGLTGGQTIVAAGGELLRNSMTIRPWLARDPQ